MPNSNAKPAIIRNGVCPAGWHAEGNYCVANNVNPKNVIARGSACPSGYHSEGSYCVQN